jgi:hypothetical protein
MDRAGKNDAPAVMADWSHHGWSAYLTGYRPLTGPVTGGCVGYPVAGVAGGGVPSGSGIWSSLAMTGPGRTNCQFPFWSCWLGRSRTADTSAAARGCGIKASRRAGSLAASRRTVAAATFMPRRQGSRSGLAMTGLSSMADVADMGASSGSQSDTLRVAPQAVTINLSPAQLPATNGCSGYKTLITGSGGTPPYTFSWSGNLPPGLTLSTNGAITGIPAAADSYQFTITATDSSATPNSGSLSYPLAENCIPIE